MMLFFLLQLTYFNVLEIMIRKICLVLSFMTSVYEIRAALPETIALPLKTALAQSPCVDVICRSISDLYDQESNNKNKRVIENFLLNLIDPQTRLINGIEAHYESRFYVRTGATTGVDSEEWNEALNMALMRYKQRPRAHPCYHFNIFSQELLDFTEDGHCSGLSLLFLVAASNKVCTLSYNKYPSTAAIPFDVLIKELPNLSLAWFHRTYQGLISGLRPRTKAETIDRMIMRSLVDFFQEHVEFTKQYGFLSSLPETSGLLHESFEGRESMSSLDIGSEKFSDFFYSMLPNMQKSQKVYIDIASMNPEAFEITYGHAIALLCENDKFSVWDPNGFSFDAENAEEFIEKMRRFCRCTFPQLNSDENYTLNFHMVGIAPPDVDLDVEEKYRPVFQPTLGSVLNIGTQRSNFGGVSITFGMHYFLDSVFSGVPKILSSVFANPLFVQHAFFQVWHFACHAKQVLPTPYAVPKKSFLSHFSPIEKVISKAKSECALLRAFERVVTFSNEVYLRSLLKEHALVKRAERQGTPPEDRLPNPPIQSALWDQVEEFYRVVGAELRSLGDLQDVEARFNLPQAKAIAEKFQSAKISQKIQLLKDYVHAGTGAV